VVRVRRTRRPVRDVLEELLRDARRLPCTLPEEQVLAEALGDLQRWEVRDGGQN
jgi:hypothetical protein